MIFQWRIHFDITSEEETPSDEVFLKVIAMALILEEAINDGPFRVLKRMFVHQNVVLSDSE